MPAMNEMQIAQFEARLEMAVEGVFAYLFGRRIHAHDVALHLARAMENGLRPASDGDPRLIAPDYYAIHVSYAVQQQIQGRYPGLAQALGELLVEVAASAGYRLRRVPGIDFVPDAGLSNTQMKVFSRHVGTRDSTTTVMKRIQIAHEPAPRNAQVIINGGRIVPLEQTIISIGRSQNNTIVLDDPYTSRLHAQIRLRFGCYTIFDTDSQAGVFVNDVRVREHRLQPGDVIRMGATTLLYLEDGPADAPQTDTLEPVDFD
jgi:hypothetical protein